MPGWDDLLSQLTTIYALPSALALVIKLIIFYMARSSLDRVNTWVWVLFAALFGLNVSELVLYAYIDMPSYALPILNLYFVFALIGTLSFTGLAVNISGFESTKSNMFLVGIAFVAVLSVVIPNGALDGATSLGYSVTRIAGPYYWVVEVTVLGGAISAVAFLSYCLVRGTTDRVSRCRALAILIACLPWFITVTVTLISMHFGANYNGAMIIPICINIFLIILIYVEKEKRLFNFMAVLPRTEENRKLRALKDMLFDPSHMDLRANRDFFERQLINSALEYCNGNKLAAAKLLGISRPHLYSKLAKGEVC